MLQPLYASRRQLLRILGGSALATGLALHPSLQGWAQQASDFIEGPPVPDVLPQQISPHVWMIYAKDGFPTPQNQGLMANIVFVVTQKGVVVVDSGSSLQIGQMALRMIARVTSLPVIAIFNSHYHGDHWLGNDAFARVLPQLPIYALEHSRKQIEGVEGNAWRSLMERWTQQATASTRIVAPNRDTHHGAVFTFGDITLRMHHYGVAHTPSDLCIEVVEDKICYVGDVAMNGRIANMDDGSYVGTFGYYASLEKACDKALWVPGHGLPARDLLHSYGEFLHGIYDNALETVKAGGNEAQARQAVLADPRVVRHASTMQGFANNIGKYASLAFLEAEKEAF